jgi:hypothetical protein
VTDHEDIALAHCAGQLAAREGVPAWEAVGGFCEVQLDAVVFAFVDGLRGTGHS